MFAANPTKFFQPWRELLALQNAATELFATTERSALTPNVQVWTKPTGALCAVELPGASLEDIEVSALGSTLTVHCAGRAYTPHEGEVVHRQERGRSEVHRAIELPFKVDAAGVTAAYKDGVLEIEAPRAADDMPRHITIHTK